MTNPTKSYGFTKIFDTDEITSLGGGFTITAIEDSRGGWAPTIYFNEEVIWQGDILVERKDAIYRAQEVIIKYFKRELRGYK